MCIAALGVVLLVILVASATAGSIHPARSSGISSEISVSENWLQVTVIDNLTVANQVIPGLVNSSSMCVFAVRFRPSTNTPTFRVQLRANLGRPAPTVKRPVIASVRNSVGGDTFTIPYQVVSHNGTEIALEDHVIRYICPTPLGQEDVTIVTVSSGWPAGVRNESYHFELRLIPVGHWDLNINESQKLVISPSDPAVFEFSWSTQSTSADKILLRVDSLQAHCKRVAIQHKTCPLATTEQTMTIDSHVFSVSRTGGVTILESDFPDGFYVVISVLENDFVCGGVDSIKSTSRKDSVKLSVISTESHAIYALIPVGIAVILLALGLSNFLYHPSMQTGTQEDEHSNAFSEGPILVSTDIVALDPSCPHAISGNCAIYATVIFILLGHAASNVGQRLALNDIDRDQCFYNNLCLSQLVFYAPFGRFLSALVYAAAAVAFFLASSRYCNLHNCIAPHYGVQRTFEIDRTVAAMLLLQSLVVALDAQCPNPNNHQLQFLLIYLLLALLSYNLFQRRRPANAINSFTPLIFTASVFTIGCIKHWVGNGYAIWVLIGIFHLVGVIASSLQLYITSRLGFGVAIYRQICDRLAELPSSANFKVNRGFLVLVAIFNTCMTVSYGLTRPSDFSKVALAFCIVHFVMHILYYVLQKCLNGEEVHHAVKIFFAGGVIMLIACLTLYVSSPTINVEVSPSLSRELNRACIGSSPFDTQDVFHMMMTVALYSFGNAMLLCDWDVSHTQFSVLPVF